MRPRRAQQAITFRSDRAAARLRLLTRDGLSQAEVIERALEDVPVAESRGKDSLEARLARVRNLIGVRPDLPSMAEFDAAEYDARGNPR
jgi:antitoxin VapB